MTNRIGGMWWVGWLSLILVTILFSRTASRQPWPSTPTHTTNDLTYTKLTPHLFLHNLSHSSLPCTSFPNTHTHTHIHSSVENILMVSISIVKINCAWFDSINSEIAMASGSAKKHPQWSKLLNNPWKLVWFVMRRPLSQNEPNLENL